MNIVITMAGHGSRFSEAGFSLPKPLIPVHGIPMYARAASCLPLSGGSRLVFVCLADHLERFDLAKDIYKRFSEFSPEIVALPAVTRGQAETVWAAAAQLRLNEPLLIHNADTLFKSDFEVTLSHYPEAVGIMGVFQGSGDHWSFARLSEDEEVLETAEKLRISPWSSTGLYYFNSAKLFGDLVVTAIQSNKESSELYIAPLYNSLIQSGLEVRVDLAHDVVSLGTPQELHAYLFQNP